MSQLTISEAAIHVGKSTKTVYHRISTGELTATLNHDGIKTLDLDDVVRVFGDTKITNSAGAFSSASDYEAAILNARLEAQCEGLKNINQLMHEVHTSTVADNEFFKEWIRNTTKKKGIVGRLINAITGK